MVANEQYSSYHSLNKLLLLLHRMRVYSFYYFFIQKLPTKVNNRLHYAIAGCVLKRDRVPH